MAVSFQLTRIPFATIVDHVWRHAGIQLPMALGSIPWIYLSGFYYTEPKRRGGLATATLRAALQTASQPFVLCCEPVLGSDPRSITEKNADLTPNARYAGLCSYYEKQFGLANSIPTSCTLRTALTGHGLYGERHLIFGVQNTARSILQ